VDEGFLVGSGSRESSVGRRPETFRVNGDRGFFLLADIGGSQTRLGVGNLSGRILGAVDIYMDVNKGPKVVLPTVIDGWERLADRCGVPLKSVMSAAVGVPGPVDLATGRISRPPMMIGWDEFDVGAVIRETLGMPTIVDKDTNFMAMGELVSRRGVKEMLVLKVGMGIGAGIVSRGGLVRGAHGAAGDLGHLPGRNNRPCRCGQIGCVEATAGGWAIAERLRDAGYSVYSSADIVALGQKRDPLVLEELRAAGREIGQVASDAVGLMNPEVVVIGGNLALASDSLISGVRQSIFERSHPLASKDLQVVLSTLKENAGLRGAIVLAFDLVFSPDLLRAGGARS